MFGEKFAPSNLPATSESLISFGRHSLCDWPNTERVWDVMQPEGLLLQRRAGSWKPRLLLGDGNHLVCKGQGVQLIFSCIHYT